MAYTKEDVELVEKHVAQAERNVRQQRQILSGLSESGYPTGEALQLLTALEAALRQLQQRRSTICLAVAQQQAAVHNARPSRPSLGAGRFP